MARIIKLISILSIFIVATSTLYASDWGIVGKVLTGIEGTRLITGGKVDIIGAITGINNTSDRYHAPRANARAHRSYNNCCQRVWVPQTTLKKVWVPRHREYDPYRGEVIVEGHYLTYEIQTGGYWQTTCPAQKEYRYSRWRR